MDFEHAINRNVIENIDDEIREEVLAIFLEDANLAVIALNSAVEQNDLETIRHYAHKIKGASLFVGAEKLAATAKTLEHSCKLPDYNVKECVYELSELVTQLETYLNQNFLNKNKG